MTDSSWEDLSHLLETYPYFEDKIQLFEYLWANGALLIGIAGGPVNPHTRTWDLTHAGIPTLTLTRPDAEYPARFAWGLNRELGLGHVLNTETREAFSARATQLLSQPGHILALREYILQQQKQGQGLFDRSRVAKYLLAVVPELLTQIRLARANPDNDKGHPKLSDVDATRFYTPPEPRPLFQWGSGFSNLGDNEGMEANQVLAVMVSKGCRFKDSVPVQVLAILSHVQPLMHLDRVAGVGGSRVTLVGRLKEAGSACHQRVFSQCGLFPDEPIALKLECSPFTADTIHNSEIVREAQALQSVSTEMERLGPMKHCLPRLLPLLAREAAVGVHQRGDDLLPFLLCKAVQEDLGHSVLLSTVEKDWKRAEINDNTRILALMILNTAYFMEYYIGLVLMDHSYGNLFLLPARETMPWLNTAVADTLSGPGGVGWCDLGSAIYVGPRNARLDDRVDALIPLARACTKSVAEGGGGMSTGKTLIRLVVGTDGIASLGNAKLEECRVRRKENHGGLGRPEGATPGFYCTRLRAQWRNAGERVLTIREINAWESFGLGALIYGFFCPWLASVTREAYVEEQRHAASTPANMLATMLKYVGADAREDVQLETAASWANLLYHLMRPDYTERLPVSTARLHPALTNRALSLEEWKAISSEEGYACPGGLGPPRSPWKTVLMPGCVVKMEGRKGPGVVFNERLENGQLACLYVALEQKLDNGVGLHELIPCRSNVDVNDDGRQSTVKQVALGILPLKVMRDLHSMGACLNAGDTLIENNLILKRNEAWADGMGRIFMPLYVSAQGGIDPGVFCNWSYNPFGGKGGLDSYVFNDALFMVDEGKAAADSAKAYAEAEAAAASVAKEISGRTQIQSRRGRARWPQR